MSIHVSTVTAECNWEASPPAFWSAALPSPTSGKGLFYLLFWDFKKASVPPNSYFENIHLNYRDRHG